MGAFSGVTGGLKWEAYLANGPVSYGLDPATLYKGRGRIVRLVLYAPVPGTTAWRKVASYHRGWVFGRTRHLPVLRTVVSRLERLA